jgi:hypothetical protein
MGRHVKQIQVKVKLSKAEAEAVRELAKKEGELRKDAEVGAATILREYAMPLVFERLAELKAQEALQPAGAE